MDMQKRSNIIRPGDLNPFAKKIVDLVTGNPIMEDISPIARKEKNPAVLALGKPSEKARATSITRKPKKDR